MEKEKRKKKHRVHVPTQARGLANTRRAERGGGIERDREEEEEEEDQQEEK